jgi:chromosome segregation ATPase
MKPIKLIFSGLNSYRTQQVVDFETLGADGLFGIFGPTGSGKSSILDVEGWTGPPITPGESFINLRKV